MGYTQKQEKYLLANKAEKSERVNRLEITTATVKATVKNGRSDVGSSKNLFAAEMKSRNEILDIRSGKDWVASCSSVDSNCKICNGAISISSLLLQRNGESKHSGKKVLYKSLASVLRSAVFRLSLLFGVIFLICSCKDDEPEPPKEVNLLVGTWHGWHDWYDGIVEDFSHELIFTETHVTGYSYCMIDGVIDTSVIYDNVEYRLTPDTV